MYEENKYKPLSPWEYFGYGLLFSVPVVGLIFLLIFSFSGKNINRRNFARSYFCGLALLLIIWGVMLVFKVFLPSVLAFVIKYMKIFKNFLKNTLLF